jgi:hypothetical protein
MAYTLLIHLNNTDPVFGEVDELPSPTDNYINVANLRTRDGKDVKYIEATASSVIFPWHRIVFIEVIQADEEEEVMSFVRE